MTADSPDELLVLFHRVADAVAEAVSAIPEAKRRLRAGGHPGQYFLDVVADAVALDLLHEVPVAVVSEESGASGVRGTGITVVLDPVDGSTNCSRRIGYWATSLCAIDASGPLASLVVNHACGYRVTATRGGGAYRDGVLMRPSGVSRVEDAIVGLAGLPSLTLPWAQFRALGCASLALCEIAAGGLDGYVDGGSWHAPWDYLGGLLACTEAGAVIVDADGQQLETSDPLARRQLIAAGTPELLALLKPAAGTR